MNAADEATTMNTLIVVVVINNLPIIIILKYSSSSSSSSFLLPSSSRHHHLTKEGIHCSISYLPQTVAVEYSAMFLKHWSVVRNNLEATKKMLIRDTARSLISRHPTCRYLAWQRANGEALSTLQRNYSCSPRTQFGQRLGSHPGCCKNVCIRP